MIYFKSGSENTVIDSKDLESAITAALEKLGARNKVLVVPPDCTRFHSRAGELTSYIYSYYKENLKDILPALGTHSPMTDKQINEMYKGIPLSLFRVHDWRKDVVTVGTIPGEFVSEITGVL